MLAKVSTKLQKWTFFDNFRTMTHKENMETGQMTPFFSSTFSAQTFCNISFVFENSQNSFSCCPPFDPFWSGKYLNFGQNLLIQTVHHTLFGSTKKSINKRKNWGKKIESWSSWSSFSPVDNQFQQKSSVIHLLQITLLLIC